MKKQIVIINGTEYEAEAHENVLQVAERNGIDIPHFCFHEDLPLEANCRACLVQDANTGKVVMSCTVPAKDGTRILTTTPEVEKLRRKNLELLLAGHKKLCTNCQKNMHCKTACLMEHYKITGNEYVRNRVKEAIHKMGTAAEFDPNLCIACNKCIKACEHIGIGFLQLKGKASETRVGYNEDPKVDCIYCGQCTVVCPVNAIREQSHIEQVEAALKDKSKIVIAQTAPSVRASIGEEFGMPYGQDITGKLFTAYRKLGFDKVFDVNMGADITTMVEAEELVERIHSGEGLPMFTSCCPGWVKYVEFYHPELIPNLTTARSPQIHSGGAYKTWWAKKAGVDPKDIVVVSIMPCTSKKYETTHEKLKIDGLKPVDFSLTTREIARLIRKHKIDFANLQPSEVDLAGTYSGAAVVYGASGGVMESALRTAYFMVTGQEFEKIDFTEVRGIKGFKKANIKIGDLTLKVAVVATAKNVQYLLRELKKNPHAFDYVEVMACPGGCLGGGGQPNPSSMRIIKERIKGIYGIDKKMQMRRAHENPVVKEFFEYADKLPKKERDAILYTNFSPKRKFE